jgi:hypothetical protein
MTYKDAHKANKKHTWIVYCNVVNPYIASTMARYLHRDINTCKDWIHWAAPQHGHYMKLSAGQSKVIEALYKKENTNE